MDRFSAIMDCQATLIMQTRSQTSKQRSNGCCVLTNDYIVVIQIIRKLSGNKFCLLFSDSQPIKLQNGLRYSRIEIEQQTHSGDEIDFHGVFPISCSYMI